jgi:hypothetical protein
MSGYAAIDATITMWAADHALQLCTTGFANDPARFIYVSSDAGECFQIWVEEPKDEVVTIHAADIETHDDEELSEEWTARSDNLRAVLDEAFETVCDWMKRHDPTVRVYRPSS